jgi:glutamate-1-semialdehyde 2,1-aminomutase
MMALRLARAYTGRERVVKLVDHFHGWHDLVVGRQSADEAHPHSAGVPSGFYDSLTIVPSGDEEALHAALAERDVAAVILEPTGAHWGLHPLAPSYLHAARRMTEDTGALFIMDEVITGFRLAPGGASERYNVMPDLSTHAKILAGGLPGGCVTGREDVMTMLEVREGDSDWNEERRVTHQGTFNANPVAAAAGLAALRLIEKGGETKRAEEAAAKLVRGLNVLFAERNVPGSAWTVSSIWHLNLGTDGTRPSGLEWEGPDDPPGVAPNLVAPLKWALFNHGVDLMGTGGMTSSAHTDADIDATVAGFAAAIEDLRAEGLLA